MSDNVHALRRIANVVGMSHATVINDAADELDVLRHALKQINGYSRKFIQHTEVSQQEKPQPVRRNDGQNPVWDKYASMNLAPKRQMKFAFESIPNLTPEQMEMFGYHKMTNRAWRLVRRVNLLDRNSFISARAEKIRFMPNVGRVTLSEVAILRSKILNQHQKKAA
jgi:hypothetical protein